MQTYPKLLELVFPDVRDVVLETLKVLCMRLRRVLTKWQVFR